MSTNCINNCTASVERPVSVEFCSIPPAVPVTTAGYSPDGVAFSLFVYRGGPRAAQWVIDLVTIDLGHLLKSLKYIQCKRHKSYFEYLGRTLLS